SAAVQLAKLSGATVIGLTRSEPKAAALREDGADEVVVEQDPDGAAERVRELTGGKGVDVVVDTVGAGAFGACFDALAVHGRFAMVGDLFGES
ncbi:zinc-binding dehydrogenase, partial [Escherichia coli]